MPTCEERNRQQLVYIKSEGVFYTCEASGWESISIAGDKGDTGATGESGASGTTSSVGGIAWVDSSTGLTWYVGEQITAAVHVCSGGYSKPSNTQALTAMANGLTSVMSLGGWCAWADTTGGAGNSIRNTNTAAIQVIASGTYCNTLCYK